MKKTLVLHPFFFAVFPVLFLFSQNLGGYRLSEILPLLAVALAAAAAVWLGLWFLTKNARKAGLIVSLLLVLFSSCGYVCDMLRVAGVSVPVLGPAAIVIPVYLAILAAGLYGIARTRSDLVNLTRILNVSAGFLVLFSGARIGAYEFRVRRARELSAIERGAILRLKRPEPMRNIYYIILDAYGRRDVLADLYGYDNSELIAFLRSNGFYIAEGARTNYSYTILSLAASLNFDYPDNPAGMYDENDWLPMRDLIGRSKVSRLLKDVGYRFISFGGDPGEILNADISMRPPRRREFTEGLLRTTAAGSLSNPAEGKRTEILYPFEHLGETARMGFPVFVFAHIMAPHRPFVFAADGTDPGCWGHPGNPPTNLVSETAGISRSEYIRHYAGQIACIDKLAMKAIAEILANSAVPPIIVLQGDHGPGAYCHPDSAEGAYLAERMSILNAYHLPDGGEGLLYDSITPVNTFRVIFRHYFGAQCPLREDRSFFSPGTSIWRLTDVTGMIGGAEDRKRLEMLKSMEYFPPMPAAGGEKEEADTPRIYRD